MKAHLSFLYEMEDYEWCPEKLGWPTGGGYSLSLGQRPTLIARASIMPVVEESWAPQGSGVPLAVWGHLKSHLTLLAGILPLSLQLTIGGPMGWENPPKITWLDGSWVSTRIWPLASHWSISTFRVCKPPTPPTPAQPEAGKQQPASLQLEMVGGGGAWGLPSFQPCLPMNAHQELCLMHCYL